MNQTDLKLYELLGDKTLSFGCLIKREGRFETYLGIQGGSYYYVQPSDSEYVRGEKSEFEIISHEPTSTDLFKWMIDNDCAHATLGLWDDCLIFYGEGTGRERVKIPFDLSKKLIDQSEETKLDIISLIESHAK